MTAFTAACAGVFAGPAFAAGTAAGTNITNVATATYDLPNGGEASVDSNVVTLKVDELIDVTVSWGDPADVATSPGLTGQPLKFTVTNGGNGAESFTLAALANGGGDDFDPAITGIVLDSNGNGAYDAGVDTVYSSGSNDPQLEPDQAITVFVLSSIPAGAGDGRALDEGDAGPGDAIIAVVLGVAAGGSHDGVAAALAEAGEAGSGR
ncbi:MAG TPA: hypothetical protein VF547_08945, partial [Allosphingosinicella sp.]